MNVIWLSLSNTHNKAFKRDSCRVAFWACGEFGVKVVYGKLVYAAFTL
ncbi:TPA: DUF3265 domain-containing protein [Vibrio parahaemolyticus]|nr:DUF3265 domain-containing protein [Vibrio parahaemolyticus]HCG7655463.1 DUF3265 domain-containing protein [Vibrio parahaemolyticus]